MRVGILGGGNISETHARAARSLPGVEIIAICGTNREKTAHLAEIVGGAVYDRVDEFLAHRPMDMVAIGSPSGVHGEQAVAALRHGLHVLVEKPLDITTERVDAVIREADRTGQKVGVFFQDRLKPDIVKIKSIVDTGQLGKPVLASGRVKWYRPPDYYGDSRWRGTWALDGGGALMNQAIHTVDLLLWIFGPVVRVSGSVATRLHRIEVEDTAAAVFEFASGALGTLEAATSVFPGYSRRVELTGAQGTVVLEHDRIVSADLRTSSLLGSADAVSGDISATSPVVADTTPHRRIFEDFIRAIRTDGTPVCDARAGRRSVEVVQAIYRSAQERRAVELNTAGAVA
jgi:UDP-N-acetyl-2-amino-2-deoxyglucuronate dehydrogenase